MRSRVAMVLLLLCPATAAATPTPDQDPFFKVPAGLGKVRNGTVLDSREIEPRAGGFPLPATAWQVKYRTQNTQGAPTATVTTVMVPDAPAAGPRPLLSYQTAEDGVAGKCAPSYAISGGPGESANNSSAEVLLMAMALQRGWIVSAPDYEGPDSAFLGTRGEGRMVLDGIKAARAFRPAGVDPKAPVGMWGYSGGAVATSVAAQIQRSHAPRIPLKAIALGGVVADIEATIDAFDATASGAIPMGFVGVDRAFPRFHLPRYLNDTGRAAMKASEHDCINDAVARNPTLHMADMEARPNTLRLPRVQRLLRRISPLTIKGKPTAPVYEYHSAVDELAPIGPARKLIARYCKAGVRVQHTETLAGEHVGVAVTGAPGALDYLEARFAGAAAPSTC